MDGWKEGRKERRKEEEREEGGRKKVGREASKQDGRDENIVGDVEVMEGKKHKYLVPRKEISKNYWT